MAYCKNALARLLDYESDSDKDSGYTSEDEKKRKANSLSSERKRKIAKYDNNNEEDMAMDFNEEISDCTSNSKSRIPLPEELCCNVPEVIDDPSLHQGRTRAFPHERGNWASLIYIPLTMGIHQPHFKSLIASLVAAGQENNIDLYGSTEFHVSLSRTLILRLHLIQPLVQDIRKKMASFSKFSMWMYGLGVYCNDKKERTFIGLKVCHGKQEILDLVGLLNESLLEYKLPTFYEDCSFHLSLAWCNGDKMEELLPLLPQLEGVCDHYFNIESDIRTFESSQNSCPQTIHSGNKHPGSCFQPNPKRHCKQASE